MFELVLDGFDFPVLGLVLFAVVVVVATATVGPPLLAITIGLVEIIGLVVFAVAGIASRVLFGQPWEIIARRGDELLTWRAVGYRAAKEVAAEVDQSLRLGTEPSAIAPGSQDNNPPVDLSAAPALYSRPAFRIVGRALGVALAVAVLVGVGLAVNALS